MEQGKERLPNIPNIGNINIDANIGTNIGANIYNIDKKDRQYWH